MSSAVDALVEPAFFTAPDYHKTFGREVGELAAMCGFPPDPEQQLILDAQFGVDRRGRLTAFEVAVIAPRQNIKTGWLKIAALGKAFIMNRPLHVWSAHEFSTAQEAFRDLTILIESTPMLDQRVQRIYRGNGDEAIELKGGVRIKFKARTKAGGRGLTGDDVDLDEAFALMPDHMGALLPTLSTKEDPQVSYASSAGLAHSEVLRGIRDRGRAGKSRRLVYIEWCDTEPCASQHCTHDLGVEGCRLDSREAWGNANTQMGRRISESYIAAERQALPPHEFGRERLGRWDEPGALVHIFGSGAWGACFTEMPRPDPAVLGLAVSVDRTHSSIAAATEAAIGAVDRRPGTDWIVAEVKRIGLPVAVDSKGPTADLIPALTKAGVKVLEATTSDYLDACASIFDRVQQGTIKHFGDTELEDAVTGAVWRPVADRRAFARRTSTSDVSMLEAATLAAWGARIPTREFWGAIG